MKMRRAESTLNGSTHTERRAAASHTAHQRSSQPSSTREAGHALDGALRRSRIYAWPRALSPLGDEKITRLLGDCGCSSIR